MFSNQENAWATKIENRDWRCRTNYGILPSIIFPLHSSLQSIRAQKVYSVVSFNGTWSQKPDWNYAIFLHWKNCAGIRGFFALHDFRQEDGSVNKNLKARPVSVSLKQVELTIHEVSAILGYLKWSICRFHSPCKMRCRTRCTPTWKFYIGNIKKCQKPRIWRFKGCWYLWNASLPGILRHLKDLGEQSEITINFNLPRPSV